MQIDNLSYLEVHCILVCNKNIFKIPSGLLIGFCFIPLGVGRCVIVVRLPVLLKHFILKLLSILFPAA